MTTTYALNYFDSHIRDYDRVCMIIPGDLLTFEAPTGEFRTGYATRHANTLDDRVFLRDYETGGHFSVAAWDCTLIEHARSDRDLLKEAH